MSSNQKFSISASNRYALALFELAQEESQLDRIEKEAEEVTAEQSEDKKEVKTKKTKELV